MTTPRRADSVWVSTYTQVTPGMILRTGNPKETHAHAWAVPDLLEETQALLRLARLWSTADAQIAGRIQAAIPSYAGVADGAELQEALRDCVYWLGERILANSGKLSAQDVSHLTGLPLENFKTKEQLEQSVANLVRDMGDNLGRAIKPAADWTGKLLWIGGGLAVLYIVLNRRRTSRREEE